MDKSNPNRGWTIKRHLSSDALKEYVSKLGIQRSQVVAITEPQDGSFSLIFEPTDEQANYMESEEGQIVEVLDTLFGPAITPIQSAAGEDVEVVPVIPPAPGVRAEC